MTSSGLIDNREINFKQKFSDFCKHTINLNLASGYFYVSGFDLVKEDLKEIKRIRIIMGNETDPETATELSVGHRQKVENELINDLNKISVKNAERIFKEAIKVLEGNMPKPSDDCSFCKWVDNCNCELK